MAFKLFYDKSEQFFRNEIKHHESNLLIFETEDKTFFPDHPLGRLKEAIKKAFHYFMLFQNMYFLII